MPRLYFGDLTPFNHVTHFNIERELTRNDIPDLLMSVNVDMIGKNEVPVFSQVIDFVAFDS